MNKTILLAASAFSLAALSTPLQAQTIAALVGNDTLVHIDAKAAKVTKTVKITGTSGALIGMDVRPSDGMLYALAADGTVSTIDPMTGKATTKSKLETVLPAGVAGTVDFNPVADRMRIIGQDGTNLRANVDDGKVTTDKPLNFAEADANKGKTPGIVAGAYINAVKGAKETTLYDITADGTFVKQAPPNDGVLVTMGPIGVKPKAMAFDISTDAQGMNTGWLMADDMLYKVDLTNGKAMSPVKVAGVVGAIRKIAVLPAL